MIKKTFLNDIVDEGQDQIKSSDKALSYLNDRGVTSQQIDAFSIGYIPSDTSFTIENDSYDASKFKSRFSGIAGLKGKLVLPVRDPVGNIVGIHLRSPSHEKKDYMKYYLWRSKATARFFGIKQALPRIWETETVYLCEGLFDLFPLQRIHPNTVCTLTAKLSSRQLKFLKRFTREIYIVFDQDEQGDKFYESFTQYHSHEFEKIGRLEYKGKDISECWSMLGEDDFQSLIREQEPKL